MHDGFVVNPLGFDSLMRTTQSLKELLIFDSSFENIAALAMAAEALGANTTLESLCIGGDDDVMEPILLRLGAHPGLRQLIAECLSNPLNPYHADALVNFLHASRTLERLRFYGFYFSKDSLEPIMEAIHSNELLTKLKIESSANKPISISVGAVLDACLASRWKTCARL
jgi:hypothetical protein